MPLTNAEKQKRWRDRRNALAKQAEQDGALAVTFSKVRHWDKLNGVERHTGFDGDNLPLLPDYAVEDFVGEYAEYERFDEVAQKIAANTLKPGRETTDDIVDDAVFSIIGSINQDMQMYLDAIVTEPLARMVKERLKPLLIKRAEELADSKRGK
jgi:hypothetical protein